MTGRAKATDRTAAVFVQVTTWRNVAPRLAIRVSDVDAIRAKTVKPRALAIGRLALLDLQVVFAQRTRAPLRLHRL